MGGGKTLIGYRTLRPASPLTLRAEGF